MAGPIREKIRLVSSAGTGHFYTTTKNKRLHPEKMETKKYDPVVRKHVAYKEAKISNDLFAACLATDIKTRDFVPGFFMSGIFHKERERRGMSGA